MTLVAYLAGSDKAHMVRDLTLSTRADGSPGFGGIVFDDRDKTLDVRGWMKVVVHETDCTDAPILFSGYVGPRTQSRTGPGGTYKAGGSRYIDCTLVDENAVLHIRLISGSDGSRPAETHIQRIDWLLESAYLSGLIDSDALVDRSDPRPFGAANYRGQYPDDVLTDLAGPIFRTFFVFVDGLTGDRILFFDTPTATVGTSDLTISNVLSDLSSTCFPPSIEATLNRDPSEVFAKVRYTGAAGSVIENDDDTRDEFFLDNGVGYRGIQVDNSRIGSLESAREMARNLLARNSVENDTINVTIEVPSASAGLLRAGQRVGVRFSHLPGYETLTYIRVTECTITQAPGRTDRYLMQLELNNHGLWSVGGSGAPPPDDFPYPPQPGQEHEWSGSVVANRGVGGISSSGGPSAPLVDPGLYTNGTVSASGDTDELVLLDGHTYHLHWQVTAPYVAGDERVQLYIPSGINVLLFDRFFGDSYYPPPTVTSFDPGPPQVYTVDTDFTVGGGDIAGYLGVDVLSGTPIPDHSWTWWIDSDTWVPIPPDPPSPGQRVLNETATPAADGATTTFYTAWPFADGSLQVVVSGTSQTGAIVSTDGAAGSFVLPFAPTDAGEQPIVSYQGR